ncbi:MAG TPA: TonB-dependent receptor [Gemmatimonadales bacterium]|nr:TonB-dependent receptor [Gemmatimonadales bacterium]
MRFVAALAFLAAAATIIRAQEAPALVTLRVIHGDDPVRGARVEAGSVRATTGSDGVARLRLARGSHVITVSRIGFAPETLAVTLDPPRDTTLVVEATARATELEAVIVTATRSERRVEDEPSRVEVLPREEVEEKLLMTPGDVAMLMNETGGLRVQTTSPSLGGATVRIQGLRGRYTQLLTDGLPLYGGQTGSLGLLQIPPMDLAQVEVIKGAASALYGPAALGGVVNLVSRRPGVASEVELLLNQTTRGGTDGVLWASAPVGEDWGYTVLAGAHRQSPQDVDADGWADLPGFERLVIRPRLFHESRSGVSLFLTAGTTLEDRSGGTLPGRVAPDGTPFPEQLTTRRVDLGALARVPLRSGPTLNVRGSVMQLRHGHVFGPRPEDDRHSTAFAEATIGGHALRGSWVIGAALQSDAYRADDVMGFDYAYTVPSAFAQGDVQVTDRLAVLASGRVDAHSKYGVFANPRLSVLARLTREWTLRASAGTASFAPTPFTEETEVTGLAPVVPPAGIESERANSASLDVGGMVGKLELSAAVFGAVVRRPVATRRSGPATVGFELINAAAPTRTHGVDLLARLNMEPIRVTATYVYQRSTEDDPDAGVRRETPLTPRHAAGIVAAWERQGQSRAGVELYYTGRQALDDNPYRAVSAPYVILGFLVEHRVGRMRVFVNAENLGDVRLSRYHPLVLPAPGQGGRWTTDAWTELSGRTINGGVRWRLR